MKGYCKDALKLLRIKVICGKDCPLVGKCPRMILEEAVDVGIDRAVNAMVKIKVAKEKNEETSQYGLN